MACFLVPVAEAIVTTAAAKILKSKEQKETAKVAPSDGAAKEAAVRFSTKLGWLNHMLWGGSALLCFEHIWHGEVTPFFPFLTAAADPASAAEMLREMCTAGTAMAALVTLVWAGMLAVSHVVEARASRTPQPSEE